MVSTLARLVDTPRAQHGEGPMWNPEDQSLYWVDMLRGELLSWHPGSDAAQRHQVAGTLAAVRPRSRGGFVLGLERGFGLLTDSELTTLPDVWSDQSVRMNDGSCDSRGAFYCGSMAKDGASGRGSLYRLDPDGSSTTVLTGVTISNGLAFTPDGAAAYYVDSATQTIARVDEPSDSRSWLAREPFVRIDPAEGTPDGLCLDADGGVWVALWGGSAVQRYSPDGHLTHRIDLPVTNPTACVLGGSALTELFITSSTLEINLEAEPEAGRMFVASVEIPGIAPAVYAG